MENKNKHILVVDDDDRIRNLLKEYLSDNNYIVSTAENSEQAIAQTDYEIMYASALQKDNFYGVQFHPEKSGIEGSKILKNFIEL